MATIGPLGIALLVGLALLMVSCGGAVVLACTSSRMFMSFGLFWAGLGALILIVLARGLA